MPRCAAKVAARRAEELATVIKKVFTLAHPRFARVVPSVGKLLRGDLDEAAQPVGPSEQTSDIGRCLLGRVVLRCLKTHPLDGAVIPFWEWSKTLPAAFVAARAAVGAGAQPTSAPASTSRAGRLNRV